MSNDFDREIEEQLRRAGLFFNPIEQRILDEWNWANPSGMRADVERRVREFEAQSRPSGFDEAVKALAGRDAFELQRAQMDQGDYLEAQKIWEKNLKLLAQVRTADGLIAARDEFFQRIVPGAADAVASLGMGAEDIVREFQNRFFRLEKAELAEAVGKTFVSDLFVKSVFPDSCSLVESLGSITQPWTLIDDSLGSTKAASELMAIGRGIATIGPFADEFAIPLRNSLGDWRDPIEIEPDDLEDPVRRSDFYRRRGLDPALTDFTPEAFDEVTLVAGLRQALAHEDQDGTDEETGYALAQLAFPALQQIERRLRKFVWVVMAAHHGEDWIKAHIRPEMRGRWEQMRQEDIDRRRRPRPLFDYALLTDLLPIIVSKKNWEKIFKPVFGRKEFIQESLHRLQTIRNPVAHAYLITLEECLVVLIETRRFDAALRSVGG